MKELESGRTAPAYTLCAVDLLMISSNLRRTELRGRIMCSRVANRCPSAVRRPRTTKPLFSSIDCGAVAQLGEHLLCNYSSLSAVLPNRAAGPKSAQLCAVKSGRLFGIRSLLTAFYHVTRGLKFCGRRSSPRASRTGAVRTGIPKESCRGGAPATKGVGRPLRSSS